jgi:predicted DNA-binding WGR domain protein
MTYLTRTDPARNMNRFYVVQVMPNLFGHWTVLREWGRRSSPGTLRARNLAPVPRCANRRAAHDQAPAAAGLSPLVTKSRRPRRVEAMDGRPG